MQHKSSGEPAAQTIFVHGSAVCLGDRGVLVMGASGSGKSALALDLMGRGCTLVADDQVLLERAKRGIRMSAPSAIAGRIEARGIGLLSADCATAMLALVVDLDIREEKRLPDPVSREILGLKLPLIRGKENPLLPAAALQWLKCDRTD